MNFRLREGRRKLQPSTVIALSFIAIIFTGTLLFTLPVMTVDAQGLPLLTALFTATSSVCVTGLTLIDPAVTLSFWGQLLLMLLIEIGGISMVTFASFFLFAFKKKNSLRSMRLAQEYTNLDDFSQTKSLVRVIIGTAFTCQLAGCLLLALRFVPKYGLRGVWVSLFTSVSAYCNAGFDVLGMEQEFGSLINYNGDPLVMFTVMGLIISGGLGFFVFYDIIHYKKSKGLSLHTKVVAVFTVALILTGFIAFMVFEGSNEKTLGAMSPFERITAALFQSVTARTAGFASVDIASLRDITKVLMLVLMFIGAGSGSTGGGIKITTFAVLVMSVVSVLRNREDTVIFSHRVDKKTVYKALAIVVLGLFVVFMTCCVLFIDNPGQDGIDVFFEAVSAFATVGLSSGVTSQMGVLGILGTVLTMYIGRIGPICFVIALNVRAARRKTRVRPEGRLMVG